MSMPPYHEQLQTAEWQAKRRRILRRDRYTCQRCFRRNLPVHVHHHDYDGYAWDVPDSWLITLCDRCHALHHGKLESRPALLAPGDHTGR